MKSLARGMLATMAQTIGSMFLDVKANKYATEQRGEDTTIRHDLDSKKRGTASLHTNYK